MLGTRVLQIQDFFLNQNICLYMMRYLGQQKSAFAYSTYVYSLKAILFCCYLFYLSFSERQRLSGEGRPEAEKKIFSLLIFPQIPTHISLRGPDLSQESRAQYRSPVWLRGTQPREPLLPASQGASEQETNPSAAGRRSRHCESGNGCLGQHLTCVPGAQS